jgi:hypothetical protein
MLHGAAGSRLQSTQELLACEANMTSAMRPIPWYSVTDRVCPLRQCVQGVIRSLREPMLRWYNTDAHHVLDRSKGKIDAPDWSS